MRNWLIEVGGYYLRKQGGERKEETWWGFHNNSGLASGRQRDKEVHRWKNILLKVDTEGFEVEVLLGAKRLLSAIKARYMLIETEEKTI